MRKIFLFLCLGITPLIGYGYIIDGYVDDWGVNLSPINAKSKGYLDSNLPTGGLDIDFITEDNADDTGNWPVGPGGSTKNYYDAEAFYFDNDANYAYIALSQGLSRSGYNSIDPGDIAIGFSSGSYSYGIDVSSYDPGNKKANLYGNIKSWDSVTISAHQPYSDPWRFKITGGNAQLLDAIDFVYSSSQNTHYILEARIPLTLLGVTATPGSSITPIFLHWTMECGNDFLNLSADINPVPEPSSLVLMLLSFLGLGGRKILNKYLKS
ncbi:MAG: PEP-CTERM sorting domain-containing protein [Candidatus Omnitrophica bacterium]|nr:PEP-CTERM sorting domain-containing protein [Candidatus Omnitrophota bacterium]